VRRHEFEHVIGAAANIVEQDEFVVIGSQAILGAEADPPDALLESMEADIYPAGDPELAIILDGNLGDGSQFHRTFGYYAHGVGPETAKAPLGWEGRLIRLEIPPRRNSDRRPTALCLEPHDLVLSKCVAGRPRDWDYACDALSDGIVQAEILLDRIALLPIEAERQGHVRSRLNAMIKQLER
jgi:hypothetical protein